MSYSDTDRLVLHTLGLRPDLWDRYQTPYRNHYVTGPDVSASMADAVAQGLMVETRSPGFLPSDGRNYMATDAGKAHALGIMAARVRRKLTRGQKRYRKWLDLSEVFDITFGDYVRDQKRIDALWERGPDHTLWREKASA